MNDRFRDYLRKFVLVFFDDILVYSSNLEDHLQHLTTVFSLLSSHHFYAKLSKCVFAVPNVHYLCHIISIDGVSVDPAKIQAIVNWPIPTTVSALHGFLGLTGYYQKFFRNYAALALLLTDLLQSSRLNGMTKLLQHLTI